MLKLSISVSTALFVAFATFYSGVAEALPVAYHGLQSNGVLWSFPTLTDLANDTNYTDIGDAWPFEAMTYDGNVFTLGLLTTAPSTRTRPWPTWPPTRTTH